MHRKPQRILIADDEFLVQRMLSSLAEELNYTVCGFARTGNEVLQLVPELKPDAVLLDIKMPELDGLQACALLQELYPVPVVIVSSYDQPNLLQQASEAGAGAYLLKPPTASTLEQALIIAAARHNDLLQLKKTNETLHRALATRDLLFAVISHDLRSPLLSINSYIDMTVEKKLDEKSRQELFPVLQEKMNNLNTLLEELLEWGRSHISDITRSNRTETVVIKNLVDRMIDRRIFDLQHHQLSAENSIPAGLTLQTDRQRLQTILRNLLHNALKFTPAGGTIRFTGQSITGDGLVSISVHDTGPGMDPFTAENLFNPRNALKKRSGSGQTGHGLGLLICRDLAAAMGGGLSLDTAEGEGSCFTLTIPSG